MNGYLVFILAVLIGHYLLELVVSLLNLRALDPELPSDFRGVYDEEEYRRSQEYTRVTTVFGLIRSGVGVVATLVFILAGGFNLLDLAARAITADTRLAGLLFTGMLLLLSGAVSLPFTVYSTFGIEERFGFNTTTVKTFLLDLVKSIVLAIAIGGPLLWSILWFFEKSGGLAWLYCWGVVFAFLVVIQFLAPVVIMPLFNKFVPLEEGNLKDEIIAYSKEQDFAIRGIYTMDGSKRSTRANAFFTGFGRFRRIVFFDTLLEKISSKELVAILAHEMGHYKKKHILKMMAASVLQTGATFYILSLFINNPGLFAAFQMENLSIYASLVFFGFLYSPLSTILSIVFNAVSRRHEYEADAYAVKTTGEGQSLISGLKKLSVSNLSNLTPHQVHVMLHYSHPPVLERIRAIRQTQNAAADS